MIPRARLAAGVAGCAACYLVAVAVLLAATFAVLSPAGAATHDWSAVAYDLASVTAAFVAVGVAVRITAEVTVGVVPAGVYAVAAAFQRGAGPLRVLLNLAALLGVGLLVSTRTSRAQHQQQHDH